MWASILDSFGGGVALIAASEALSSCSTEMMDLAIGRSLVLCASGMSVWSSGSAWREEFSI